MSLLFTYGITRFSHDVAHSIKGSCVCRSLCDSYVFDFPLLTMSPSPLILASPFFSDNLVSVKSIFFLILANDVILVCDGLSSVFLFLPERKGNKFLY